jgi:hypothetical protein
MGHTKSIAKWMPCSGHVFIVNQKGFAPDRKMSRSAKAANALFIS